MNDSSPEKVTSPNSPDPSTKYDQVTYRDLVIFEERLRGNMIRLRKRKRKFEGKSIDLLSCYNHLSLLFYSSSLLSASFIGLLFLCCLCGSKQGKKGRILKHYPLIWIDLDVYQSLDEYYGVTGGSRQLGVLLPVRHVL
jgi:hypothetical protein